MYFLIKLHKRAVAMHHARNFYGGGPGGVHACYYYIDQCILFTNCLLYIVAE